MDHSDSDSAKVEWSKWQLLDSVLPTGGFAHSLGLEAAFQSDFVSHENLHSFVLQLLENTATLLLPYVYSVTPDNVVDLNKMLDATLTNEVARKASISQGSALLRLASSVFSQSQLKHLRNIHHALVFGLVCKLLVFDYTTAQRAFMFVTLRDALSAATRLNLVGPLAAAVLQQRISSSAESILIKWMNRSVDESCQVHPLLDALQTSHSYLFSRLFSS